MPTAYINLKNLHSNYAEICQMAESKRVIVVIKANAYGHGLFEVADALPQAEAFAVARINDAIRLRQHGITQRIISLAGAYLPVEFISAEQHKIDLVVHCKEHLDLLQNLKQTSQLNIWIKVDTGMHRLGFFPAEVDSVVALLQSCAAVAEIRLLSHFASADDIHNADNKKQIIEFAKFTDIEKSFANSSALINYPDLDADWPRIGLLLYGVSPTPGLNERLNSFKPAMTLTAPIIAIKMLKRGDKVGYGGVYVCPEDMTVAVVAIGYGDGYPREVSAEAYCLLDGYKCPIIGRVSMDMLSIDLRAVPQAKLGQEVELWGEQLPVTVVASWAETIAYALLAGLNSSVVRCLTP